MGMSGLTFFFCRSKYVQSFWWWISSSKDTISPCFLSVFRIFVAPHCLSFGSDASSFIVQSASLECFFFLFRKLVYTTRCGRAQATDFDSVHRIQASIGRLLSQQTYYCHIMTMAKAIASNTLLQIQSAIAISFECTEKKITINYSHNCQFGKQFILNGIYWCNSWNDNKWN